MTMSLGPFVLKELRVPMVTLTRFHVDFLAVVSAFCPLPFLSPNGTRLSNRPTWDCWSC